MPEDTGHRKTGMSWLVGAVVAALVALGVYSVVSATEGQNRDTGTPDRTQPVNQPVAAGEPTTTTTAGSREVDEYGIEVTDTTAVSDQSGVESDRAAQDIPVTDTTLPSPQPEHATAQAQQAPTTTTRAASLTTTTTVNPPVPRRVLHPSWDNRLPSTWEGLPATECAQETFKYEMERDTPSWDHGIVTEGVATNYAATVIEFALADPSYEVEPGHAGHAKMVNAMQKRGPGRRSSVTFEEYEKGYRFQRRALTDLGVSSAQDIRDMGEAAANVRWYAARVKSFIDEFSLNPDHPSCTSILAGAEAVLTPYKPSTTTP